MKREAFNQRQVALILRITLAQVRDLIGRKRITGRDFRDGWRVSREELIQTCIFSGVSTRWVEVV